MGFLVSKSHILADLTPISKNILLFRAKYYIKPPKNHWGINTGNCLTDIRHLGELDMAYFSNNGTRGQQKCHKITKDKVSENLKS